MSKVCSLIALGVMTLLLNGCCCDWFKCCEPCRTPCETGPCYLEEKPCCCPKPHFWDDTCCSPQNYHYE
ncbi:MAG: hypothetical protein H7A37_07280 [Chlamydiales bacterium]|nr:hypothetical protein [Chlamydiia bacterium]MCP5508085.1 hypothetical protein [Chlamydiales bacterium]